MSPVHGPDVEELECEVTDDLPSIIHVEIRDGAQVFGQFLDSR
jgi:hypothetical protein